MYCSNCGNMHDDDALFCIKCGVKVESIEDNTEDAVVSQVQPNNNDNMFIANGDELIADKATDIDFKKWNWGAFTFTWMWGIFNKSYKTFLTFIPLFGFFYMFVCGSKGTQWAWENRQWDSEADFKRSVKVWNRWGLGIIIINIVLLTLSLSFGGLGILLALNEDDILYSDTAYYEEDSNGSIEDSTVVISNEEASPKEYDTLSDVADVLYGEEYIEIYPYNLDAFEMTQEYLNEAVDIAFDADQIVLILLDDLPTYDLARSTFEYEYAEEIAKLMPYDKLFPKDNGGYQAGIDGLTYDLDMYEYEEEMYSIVLAVTPW